MSFSRNLRFRLEYAGFRLLQAGARALPLETASAWSGWCWRVIAPRLYRQKRALANLALAYPEMSEDERVRLASDMWENLGRTFAESFHLQEIVASDRIELEWEDRPHGSFVICGAHLGNWEWAALGTGALGISTGVVARPLDNPLLDATLTRLRSSTGNTVIEKRDATRAMLRALRGGGAIGILNDQHAHPPDAVTAPFFGRPAATSSALAKLADRTEALIVPAYAIRIAPARWRLTFEPALDVRTLSREERGVESLTARLNGILEQMVRRHPEQWLWLHNRWRVD